MLVKTSICVLVRNHWNIVLVEVADAVYQWNSDGQTIEGRCADLTEGQWSVEVTDTLTGCQATDTLLVEQLEEIVITIFPDTTFEATGGLKPYASVIQVKRIPSAFRSLMTMAAWPEASLVLTSSSIAPEALSFQVYPNPARDRLQIQGLSTEIMRLELWDLRGRLHLRQSGQQRNLRVNDVPAGMYILRIYDVQGGIGERQVVIVR